MAEPLILILCTGNSCRSHMAEGVLRATVDETIKVASAGSNPAGQVHPMAIEVMKEIDIDISSHTSKHLNTFLDCDVHTVITVCGNADSECPVFSGQAHKHHWPFEDPAQSEGNDEEKLATFRRVRDEIREKFEACAEELRLINTPSVVRSAWRR